jgi:hypothetical protein
MADLIKHHFDYGGLGYKYQPKPVLFPGHYPG